MSLRDAADYMAELWDASLLAPVRWALVFWSRIPGPQQAVLALACTI